MTAPRSAPPASRRPGIPAPSDVVAFRAHLIALAILLIETIYWLSQPCVGDFLCAPVLGFYTGAIMIPLALTFAIWRLSGRGSGVLCVDAVVAGFLIPLGAGGLGSADPMILALALVLPLALLIGLLGSMADVATHRVERWLVVTLLLLFVVWGSAGGGLAYVALPAVVAIILALAPPRRVEPPSPWARSETDGEALFADDAPPVP